MAYKRTIPTWLSVIIAIVLVLAVACLAVYCIALAKDMTFIDFIKSWFEKAEESTDTVTEAVRLLSRK